MAENIKECSKCKIKKDYSNFYKRNEGKKIRWRSLCKNCIRKTGKKYNKTNGKKISSTKWKKQNKEKIRAQWTVENNLRARKLIKESCGRCRSTKNIHAHHEDYSRPLNIVWLCAKHHKERHAELDVMI
jgi:predicted transposase YbfD/YdcC